MTAAKSMNARNMRRDLMTPRKSLTFGVPIDGTYDTAIAAGVPDPLGVNPDGVNVVIIAPGLVNAAGGARVGTDPNWGPIPLFLNPVAILGDSSMIVDYGIETWFIECGTQRAILSNRYTMSHDIDEDYWTTRTVEGVAVLRGDYLLAQKNAGKIEGNADFYRRQVLPSIPDRFKRIDEHVEVSPDELTLRYVVVDEEQPQSINPAYRVISRIEGHYSESIGREGDAIMAAVRNAGVGAAGGGAVGGPWGAAVGAIGPLIAGAATYPTGSIELYVKVYGTRIATRRSLVNTLGRVMAGFNFGKIGNVPSWIFDNNSIAFDLFNRTATLSITANVTLVKAIVLKIANQEMGAHIGLGDLANLAQQADRGEAVFPENIPARLPVGGLIDLAAAPNADVTTRASAPTTNPMYDGGTRGLKAAFAVAGGIKSPCDAIEVPFGGVLQEPINPNDIPQVRNAAVAANGNDGFPVVA